MERQQVELDAPGFGRAGTVIRYGHYGRPVLVFPSESGRAWDYENNGMVGAVENLVDDGRVKIYCVDSFDQQSWSDRGLPIDRLRLRVDPRDHYRETLTQIIAGRVAGCRLIVSHPPDVQTSELERLTEDWGGAIEFWDKEMKGAVDLAYPKFNRLVVFSTSEHSNHGQRVPNACPPGVTRKVINLYYYSSQREDRTPPTRVLPPIRRPSRSSKPEAAWSNSRLCSIDSPRMTLSIVRCRAWSMCSTRGRHRSTNAPR